MKTTLAFRALSDRTRLRLLGLLRDGELCVCDLVDALGIPQPKASRHLAYLRKAGFVVSRRAGPWTYYRLAPARDTFHRNLLACLDDVPDLAKDAKRLAARGKRVC
jgi:ArsR family transcriptional regulator